ncbi:DUF4123 domain-containing protein [Providencia rettgeri]|uniref:DUF4123 domain-containing protein n=4 Tax=Morganellaceae TaxID=1903414 RepID=A0AAD2ZIF9_PRORE|nr:DUF4123 domain-containing protein [Providencia rettgeri]
MVKPETCYAIIDAASEPDVFNLFAEHEPPASCLYSEPIQPEIVSLAPYLVEVTEEVQRWLSTRETPWGIYVYTHATMRELRQHLRKYLMVMIPGQEKPVFWRFYDPRNVWDVLGTFDNWRLHVFLGPITKLKTLLWGEETASRFERERRGFPDNAKLGGKLMRFTPIQYDAVNLVFERQFLDQLIYFFIHAKSMSYQSQMDFSLEDWVVSAFERPAPRAQKIQERYGETTWRQNWQLASDLSSFCQHHRIDDKHSYQLIAYMLALYQIYRIEDVPEEWRVSLANEMGSGNYRVHSLASRILNMLPDLTKENGQ